MIIKVNPVRYPEHIKFLYNVKYNTKGELLVKESRSNLWSSSSERTLIEHYVTIDAQPLTIEMIRQIPKDKPVEFCTIEED